MRIGILGAGRAAVEAIIGPAQRLGHQVVIVGSRSRDRAQAFADTYGIPETANGYDDVIERSDLDLVYLGVVNAAHARWAMEACLHGRNVLVEKPFTLDAEQAREVMANARRGGSRVFDGYHYAYHPAFIRALDIACSGELGSITSVDARVAMVRPAPSSSRWSFDLGGGSMLDLGCYGLDACERIAAALGGKARIASATARTSPADPRVDARMDVRLDLGSGLDGRVRCSIDDSKAGAAARDAWQHIRDRQVATRGMSMTLRLRGENGSLTTGNFVLPQLDDRVSVRTKGGSRVERLGRIRSYDLQLQAIAAHIDQREYSLRSDRDPVPTMQLIDDSFTAAGLPARRPNETSQP